MTNIKKLGKQYVELDNDISLRIVYKRSWIGQGKPAYYIIVKGGKLTVQKTNRKVMGRTLYMIVSRRPY